MTKKPLLDSTHYTNKPSPLLLASTLARRPIFQPTITNSYYWCRHVTLNARDQAVADHDMGVPCEDGCRYLVRWAISKGAKYLILDLEGAQASLANLSLVHAWVRSEISHRKSGLKVSCYTVDGDDTYYPERFDEGVMWPEWKAFLNHLDFITPSFYGYRDLTDPVEMQRWQARMQRVVAATKALTPKPILPVISPRYWDTSFVPPGTLLPEAAFKTQVAEVLAAANGLVIWDPTSEPWDPEAAWWQAINSLTSSAP